MKRLRDQADDWITIWQSECNAAATDRERLQGWSDVVEMWAEGARMAVALWPVTAGLGDNAGHAAAAGPSSREPPAGAASAAAAPDARDAAIERLAQRVAELERRLAASGEPGRT